MLLFIYQVNFIDGIKYIGRGIFLVYGSQATLSIFVGQLLKIFIWLHFSGLG